MLLCLVREDREFIERWTTSRGDRGGKAGAGMRGTARSNSYVAELCWRRTLRSREPRR